MVLIVTNSFSGKACECVVPQYSKKESQYADFLCFSVPTLFPRNKEPFVMRDYSVNPMGIELNHVKFLYNFCEIPVFQTRLKALLILTSKKKSSTAPRGPGWTEPSKIQMRTAGAKGEESERK